MLECRARPGLSWWWVRLPPRYTATALPRYPNPSFRGHLEKRPQRFQGQLRPSPMGATSHQGGWRMCLQTMRRQRSRRRAQQRMWRSPFLSSVRFACSRAPSLLGNASICPRERIVNAGTPRAGGAKCRSGKRPERVPESEPACKMSAISAKEGNPKLILVGQESFWLRESHEPMP